MTQPLSPELVTKIDALNTPERASRYAVEGNTVTGWWDFANSKLTQALVDGGASSNFRYLVTLDFAAKTYRCVEQDSGYNNGRIRAYSGYNRGFSVNPFSIVIWLIQRHDRKKRTGSGAPMHKYTYEELKQPLRAVLDADGWKRKGFIK